MSATAGRTGTVRIMSMNIERIGVELWPGAESMGYELTSDSVSITVADLGAHLAGVVLRVDDGELPITVGYPDDATDGTGYHGASVGRYANRIAGARFELDGTEYELAANEGRNQLHGGPVGFNSHAWSAHAESLGDIGRVVLQHKSKDGDMGFPGRVMSTAIYELEENRLTVVYRAQTNAPTPINLTNHTYWNLAGGTLDGHELTVAAADYVPVDDDNIPLPQAPAPVGGTRFNCNDRRSLSEVVEAGGYDHCFVLDANAEPHAVLRHESGRCIELTTNQVGLQVYTGRHLDPTRRGIALEAQCLPDTPNRPDFGDCTLRPDALYESTTSFVFLP